MFQYGILCFSLSSLLGVEAGWCEGRAMFCWTFKNGKRKFREAKFGRERKESLAQREM